MKEGAQLGGMYHPAEALVPLVAVCLNRHLVRALSTNGHGLQCGEDSALERGITSLRVVTVEVVHLDHVRCEDV